MAFLVCENKSFGLSADVAQIYRFIFPELENSKIIFKKCHDFNRLRLIVKGK